MGSATESPTILANHIESTSLPTTCIASIPMRLIKGVESLVKLRCARTRPVNNRPFRGSVQICRNRVYSAIVSYGSFLGVCSSMKQRIRRLRVSGLAAARASWLRQYPRLFLKAWLFHNEGNTIDLQSVQLSFCMSDFDLDEYLAKRASYISNCTRFMVELVDQRNEGASIKLGSLGNELQRCGYNLARTQAIIDSMSEQ